MGEVDLAAVAADWSPAPESTTGATTAWAVAAFSSLLDLPPVAAEGEELPPFWHWFGFLDHPRQDELGDDGHPAAGTFLPPIPHRRRMVAGGRLAVHRPMRVGETLRKTSSLVRREVKHGRSGAMLLVTLRHEFDRDGTGDEVLVVEEQDVVYRAQPPGTARGTVPDEEPGPAPDPSPEAVELFPSETLLFRFSALTHNPHRIHYDAPYATAVEGYPGLVVHGPLLALMLAEVPRRHRAGRGLARCDYRLARPAFAGATVRADHLPDPAPSDGTADGGTALRVAGGVPGAPPSITATITLDTQEHRR
ncbi:FAS1-like dehydratase domain-containing protein [Actinomycetospora cinnamomea]|uniref:3-methylfumaryl-CoA hydratase n=1 Tax=Actinomycetospora cinnamomea TaxID=663609 RepID=A0A2U1FA82_9PSEU|nr:MaoC family dehydratase N-terminal domain-containing protein [Actinomycetospora cinnamomea]PVZ09078.1 3-methylfumaryl-CoA hydratase [Actinomycetospora cinnamomea]